MKTTKQQRRLGKQLKLSRRRTINQLAHTLNIPRHTITNRRDDTINQYAHRATR